jgi:predicted transcriptional regulator
MGGCTLELDLSESRFGYSCVDSDEEQQQSSVEKKPQRMVALPDNIRFESVWSGEKQNITSGKVTLWVSTKGMMEQTIINIGDDDRKMALVTQVFRPEIRIEEKALSFEDLD